jgi:hypothetical protein
MVYKITPKGNYFNPQVEPGVVIDDEGNVFLRDVVADEIVQADPSPSLGTNYSFIAGGGGFGNSTPGTAIGIRSTTTPSPTSPGDGPIPISLPINPEPVIDFFAINDVDRFPLSAPTANATDVGELSPTTQSFAFSAGHQSQTHGFVSGGAANNVTFPTVSGSGIALLDSFTASSTPYSTPGGGGGGTYIGNQGNNFVQGIEPGVDNFVNASGLINQSSPLAPKIYIARATAAEATSRFPSTSTVRNFSGPAYSGQTVNPFSFQSSIYTSGSTLLAVPGQGVGGSSGNPTSLSDFRNTSTNLTREFGGPPSNYGEKDLIKAENSFMFELVPYNGAITDTITSFPFATSPITVNDVGELSIETVKAGGHSSTTHAYVSGGAIKAFPNPLATFSPYNTDYDEPAYSIGLDGFSVNYAPTAYSNNGTYISGTNLELSFVTDKIQRYPFAISGATAEQVGSLGIVYSREAQGGDSFPPSNTKNNIDGKAIFYNRFHHAAASTAEYGYLVGGKIAGVVVNAEVPNSPYYREYHYRIMTPGAEPHDFTSDRTIPYYLGVRVNPSVSGNHASEEYSGHPFGDIATHGYAPYINHHPGFNPVNYVDSSGQPAHNAPTIPSAGESHEDWITQVNLVNSDIIKFSFSSSATSSAVGQLTTYGARNRAITIYDQLAAVTGPDAMFVKHEAHGDEFYGGTDGGGALIKYPFSNMTPSVVVDVSPSSGGGGTYFSDQTGTSSVTDGYFSGGSNPGYQIDMPSTPQEMYYSRDVDKFPFSSFGSMTDVGQLTKFGSNRVGIND